jgi:branched-chain amino acid transport system ATP-binding protein
LAHRYGRHEALHVAALHLRAGEAVAILGANGAGKTTLLNAIAGILRPDEGSIRFLGTELVGLPPYRIVELGIAAVPENRHLFGPMTVMENLTLGAFARRARSGGAVNLRRVFALFPRLSERRHQPVRTMSGGEQQMVAIGRALMTQPALLLLDEPSLRLSPLIASELFAVLAGVVREGAVSILLVEQSAGRALALADRAYLLSMGRIVAEGDAGIFAHDNLVARLYLGV